MASNKYFANGRAVKSTIVAMPNALRLLENS